MYANLNFKRIQKVHTQNPHILTHSPIIHIIPFHNKNNY